VRQRPYRAGQASPEPEADLWTTAPAGIFALVTGYGSGMVDGPVPDSAMDTKSEEGEPGDEDRDPRPLDSEEQAILDRLRSGGGAAAEQQGDADTTPPGADTTLPAPPPAGGRPDPLDPVFREPTP
jgi:hypothetical protein